MRKNLPLLILPLLASATLCIAQTSTTSRSKANEDLFRAACNGDLSKVSAALDAGGDVDAQSGKGQSALMCASEKGFVKVVEMLLARGANTGLKDKQQRDAESYALAKRRSDVLELLRRHKARAAALAEQRRMDVLWQEAVTKDTLVVYADFAWGVRRTDRANEAVSKIRKIIEDRGRPLDADDSSLLDATIGKQVQLASEFVQSDGEFAGNLHFQHTIHPDSLSTAFGINGIVLASFTFSDVVYLPRQGLLCFSSASITAQGFSKKYGQVCRYEARYYTTSF
ncbi:MAG: ankyrin repeat domain-containing protein [Pyrinomonadaceae bacterium]